MATPTTSPVVPSASTVATSSVPEGGAARTPIVVDTDMAVDDLLALAAITQDQRLDLRAVTISGTGEVHCGSGVARALDVLALLGHPDVPVACGRETPLAGDHAFPDSWRSFADRAYGLALPMSTRSPAPGDAAHLLQRLAPGATLLALGPLTNIADAFALDGTLPSSVARLVVSGGALHAAGNLGDVVPGNTTAEWNLYIDPAADAAVLATNAPIVLVPLDVTGTLPITLDVVDLLDANADRSRAATLAARLLDGNPQVATDQLFFWDPAAAMVAVRPELFSLDTVDIAVSTSGADSGTTTARPGGRSVGVAATADATAITDRWLRDVTRTPDGSSLTPSPLPPITYRTEVDGTSGACTASGRSSGSIGRADVTYRGPASTIGGLVHLVAGARADDLSAWIAAHPALGENPPMVDTALTAGPTTGHTRGAITAGTWVIACGTVDAKGAVTSIQLGGTVTIG